MVEKTGNTKIIDFDWSAEEDNRYYPSTINMKDLKKEWHEDVGPRKKLKMEHDQYAVHNILWPNYLPAVPHE